MQCPKCGSGVAAEAKSCPICFADMEEVGRQQGPAGFQMPTASVPREEDYMPVVGIPGLDNVRQPEPPPPNYLSPGIGSAPAMGGGEVRVSLTGEVLEVATPTPKNIPGPGTMPPPGVRPPAGVRPGPPRPAAAPRPMSRRQEDDDVLPKQSAGPVAAIVLVLLVLGGAGFGGWYWYNNRTNPKDQAVKVAAALKAQNWGNLFDLCAWPPDKVTSSSRAEYANNVDSAMQKLSGAGGDQLAGAIKQAFSNLESTAGEPTYNGDKAEVPLTNKTTVMSQSVSLTGTAHMVKQGGIWKLDMLQADPKDPEFTNRTMMDFMGVSSMMNGAAAGAGGMGGADGGGGGGAGRRRR